MDISVMLGRLEKGLPKVIDSGVRGPFAVVERTLTFDIKKNEDRIRKERERK